MLVRMVVGRLGALRNDFEVEEGSVVRKRAEEAAGRTEVADIQGTVGIRTVVAGSKVHSVDIEEDILDIVRIEVVVEMEVDYNDCYDHSFFHFLCYHGHDYV